MQADNGSRSTVCMKGGKNQVPCESSVNGNLSGFPVTDFSHHNYIRVLTHYRAESVGEREIDFGVYLYLIDARQLILHRVFNGYNI